MTDMQPRPDSWTWAPPPAPTPVANTMPQPNLSLTKPKRNWATLVAVAVLSAGVGGGTAVGVNQLLAPAAPIVQTQQSPPQKVVQANASAPDWTATAAVASKSTVSIRVNAPGASGSGSGVVFDQEGHIVTNHHVVAAALEQGQVSVQIGDRVFEAKIVGTDPTSDLAVIKLVNPPKGLVGITFADSDRVAVGDPVMAIGNPLGLSGTVTTGIVSAVNRPVTTTQGGTATVTNAIQTSAAINPGNSGGALVNANGELIGINSAIATLGSSNGRSGNIGIGFAIESNLVKSVTQQIISTGTANHAWLGVYAQSDSVQIDGGAIVGARVTRLVAGSPAATAGLAVDDLVTAVSGKPVVSMESLVGIIRAQDVGETVDVTFVRSGKTQTVQLKLVASPSQTR